MLVLTLSGVLELTLILPASAGFFFRLRESSSTCFVLTSPIA
nr:MAG TPA: hypothetical protein [Caudoviricetes sp.]